MKYFFNICDWFVDNKLCIHFGKDKTKWILFASKFKIKNFNIAFGDIWIKQLSKVKCLWCLLDKTSSGEAMSLDFVNKINNKLISV